MGFPQIVSPQASIYFACALVPALATPKYNWMRFQLSTTILSFKINLIETYINGIPNLPLWEDHHFHVLVDGYLLQVLTSLHKNYQAYKFAILRSAVVSHMRDYKRCVKFSIRNSSIKIVLRILHCSYYVNNSETRLNSEQYVNTIMNFPVDKCYNRFSRGRLVIDSFRISGISCDQLHQLWAVGWRSRTLVL